MVCRVKQYGALVVTVALLAYIGGFARLEIVRDGAAAFHGRAREAVLAMPPVVGDWQGEFKAINARAKDLLQPNAEFTYYYRNPRTRQGAFYSVVQVGDARFMSGHAPSFCYPGNGWTIKSQEQKTWKVGEFEIKGVEYRMQRRYGGEMQDWNVRNFFIFPDGVFGWTLAEVDRAAEDYRRLAYGLAQVQFVTHSGMSESQRGQAFGELVGSGKSLEMIRVLRSGIPK